MDIDMAEIADLLEKMKEFIEVGKDTEEDPHVFIYDEDTSCTFYAHMDEVSSRNIMAAMVFCQLVDLPAELIEVKSDGIVVDGKFLSVEHFPAIQRGATIENVHLYGPMFK